MLEVRIGPWTFAILFAANAAACAKAPGSASGPSIEDPGDQSSTSGAGGGGGGVQVGLTCNLNGPSLVMSNGGGVTPSVAWNGSVLGVVWAALDASEIDAAIVSSGSKSAQIAIATGSMLADPTIYSDPAGFLVLWANGGTVMGQRIDASAKPSGAAFQVALGGTNPHPRAAPLGSDVLVAFEGVAAGSIALLSGTTLGTPIPLLGSPAFATPVSDGKHGGVFWSTQSQVDYSALSTPLALGSTDSVKGLGTNKATALSSGNAYVAWEDTTGGAGNEQVYVAKVASDGTFSAPVAAPSETGSAIWPAMTVAGDTMAVVYSQLRGGPPSIFLTLLNPDLSRVTGDFTVSPANESDGNPSIAWTGNDLAIAYSENEGQVKLALVDCH